MIFYKLIDKYKELHARQWDPTYNNPENEGFVKNLKPGNQFRFGDDETVYTILNVKEVRLYNHTSWNRMKKWDGVTNGVTEDIQNSVHYNWHYFQSGMQNTSNPPFPNTGWQATDVPTINQAWHNIRDAVKRIGSKANRRIYRVGYRPHC